MSNWRKEALEYYKNWMKEKTFSPALKSLIRITKKGWEHISSGSKSRHRNEKDKANRFNLLKVAKYIINNSNVYFVSYKNKEKYFILEDKVVITLNNKKKLTKVKVIIKEDRLGNKYFYSVKKK